MTDVLQLPPPPLRPGAPGRPSKPRYKQQFGVIVICANEREQRRIFRRLRRDGLCLRVVST